MLDVLLADVQKQKKKGKSKEGRKDGVMNWGGR